MSTLDTLIAADMIPPRVVTGDRTYNIPTDFTTLQIAIDTLSDYKAKQGKRIILNIEAGHTPNSGILVENGDFSHFWIQSEDNPVVVSASMPTTTVFIEGRNAVMPVLDCLISGDAGVGDYRILNGYEANDRSSGYVTSNSGVINVRGTGAYASGGSRLALRGANFSNAAMVGSGAGITSWASQIDAEGANVSGSGSAQAPATTNGYGAQAAHGGTLNFRLGNANNCQRYGLRATDGALLDADGATATGCGINGVRSFSGSLLSAVNVDAAGAGTSGFATSSGGILFAGGGTGTTENPVNSYSPAGIIIDTAAPRDKMAVPITATQSTTNASFEAIPGLTFSVRAGEVWLISGFLRLVGGAATTLEIALNGPTASSIVCRATTHTATGQALGSVTAFDTAFTTVTTDTAHCDFNARIAFTAAGTFEMRYRRLAGAASAQVASGSIMRAERAV